MASNTLADVAEIIMGQSPPGHTVSAERRGLPLLNGPTEFGPHHPLPAQFTTDARKRALRGDILFCVRGSTTGRMNWADQEYAIGRGVAAIRHKWIPELQPFVRAVIEHRLPALLAQATGSTFPNVSALQLAALPYPDIPEGEQRAIAYILSTLDDKIELNRRMNETLEAMGRALFKSWFVDFDPVIDNALKSGKPVPDSMVERADRRRNVLARAKAEGHGPGLPKHIADLFPDSFEDYESRDIPKGSRVKPIGHAVRCVGGSTPSTENPRYWQGGATPFVTPKDMSALSGPVILDTERHITDIGVEKISSGRLPIGTLILSSRAPIGYLAIVEVPVSVNQGVIAMICDGDLPSHYVLYWVEANMETIEGISGGTTFAEISKRNFRPIPVIVPSEKILGTFVDSVEPMHRRMVNSLRESATLASIRDALLPKLISGEVTVRNAEQFLEGVA